MQLILHIWRDYIPFTALSGDIFWYMSLSSMIYIISPAKFKYNKGSVRWAIANICFYLVFQYLLESFSNIADRFCYLRLKETGIRKAIIGRLSIVASGQRGYRYNINNIDMLILILLYWYFIIVHYTLELFPSWLPVIV